MKYAVIGTGYWGSNHVRVASELQSEGVVDSLVLCDIDEGRVADLASSFDLEYTTEYETLPDLDVDAATIATPSTTHCEIGTRLLSEGIDLLVEKPLAMSSEEAWKLVEVADMHDRTLAVGHIFRYHPALMDLKRRLDRGELGTLRYLHSTRFAFRVPRSTVGVLHSLGVHDVDISNFLMDRKPQSVYCQSNSFVREGIEDTATVVLDYGGGTSIINESWQIPVFGKRRDLIAVGSEKVAFIDYLRDNVLELYDSRIVDHGGILEAHEEGKKRHEVSGEEPLRLEVMEFIEAVENGTKPRMPACIGAETVELLELSMKADAEDRVIPID